MTPEPGGKPGLDEMYCWSCGSAVKLGAWICMVCGVKVPGVSVSSARSTAINSPASAVVTGASPARQNLPRPSTLFAVLIASVGGVFGIAGAVQAEMAQLLLLPFLWGPVAEEILKPVGVYIVLVCWPGALKSRPYTAMLSALAGVAFALVESTVYVTVYVPDHSQSFLIYRFTVTVLVHAVTSFIYGMGINHQLLSLFSGRGKLRVSNWGFFVAAIMLHALYNIVVTVVAVLN